MEMERINDNTIRVLLGNDDLAERGITVLDLLGNHKQIETFFYSILDEVDKDHSFAVDAAVTFQVMPSQAGLELLISRNALADDDAAGDDLPFDLPDGGVPEFIRQQLNALDINLDDDDESAEYPTAAGEAGKYETVIALPDFEAFVGLADALRLEGASSDLYTYKDRYYLVLSFYPNNASESEIRDQIAIAMEYGDRSDVSTAVLSEYGKLLMPTSALETGRYYFS